MHVLFVHQNFPAQFGHIASHLAERHGFRCTFVSEKPAGRLGPIELVQYRIQGGATRHNHYCSRTFENAIWHAHAVYDAVRVRPDLRPDLIVAHSGFGSSLFLKELFDCPIVNYFEYFYRSRDSDMDFRPEFPPRELDRLRSRSRNAMLLLDLENCDRGYSPTVWQRDRLPSVFRDKVETIFDGVDTAIWRPLENPARRIGSFDIPPGAKVVTYVSRGLESMRGFDIFMRVADRVGRRHPDAIFLIAGQDRVCYGGDEKFTQGKSFKDWVLSQGDYDLSRFVFLGLIPPQELAALFSLTQLHVYLTVPFVLSWSLMNALACGATVLASNTAPVREMIQDETNGLLADFADIDGLSEIACQVLDRPGDFAHLGKAGTEMIESKYSLDVCLPKMLDLYRRTLAG